MLNIAVFGSGRGSNFRAILSAIRRGEVPGARIVVAISNNRRSGILEIARNEGIPALHMSQSSFSDEEQFAGELLRVLGEHGVNFIALAGYLKHIDPAVIAAFRNRIINIHPALLPKFGGKGMYGEHVHRAVLASGERKSGATVHIVDEEYDRGPIVLQKEVAVDPLDTVESLAAKVLRIEHEIYPEAIRLFSRGNVRVENDEVVVQHH